MTRKGFPCSSRGGRFRHIDMHFKLTNRFIGGARPAPGYDSPLRVPPYGFAPGYGNPGFYAGSPVGESMHQHGPNGTSPGIIALVSTSFRSKWLSILKLNFQVIEIICICQMGTETGKEDMAGTDTAHTTW